ncbi:hypothetical protein D5693_01085 [Salmonella enterica]|nr:hypothetical protein CHD54_19365 [Salmonella enterica]EAB6269407.1 hypothetical protein [Salmonella enterica subsp. houtenae]EBR0107236.1 hypothetical protein [Salmonella enterica subsp. houtenae serovar Houten]OSD43844.1 hypothetical protein R533_12230 [Salmonella enterica subsp. houtenae serovar 40:z4,z32:-]EAM3328523.1 hypothetical protein [Salmonella enterica]
MDHRIRIITYYVGQKKHLSSKKTLNAKRAKNAIILLPDIGCSLLKGGNILWIRLALFATC